MAKRGRKRRTPSRSAAPQPQASPQKLPHRVVGVVLLLAGLAVAAVLFWQRRPAPKFSRPAAAPAQPIAGNVSYVDNAVCSGCHAEIAATYAQTAMGRSFYRATPDTMGTHLNGGVVFEHEASGRRYEIFERDRRYFLRREALSPESGSDLALEREIHYVMGSGEHARSYLHRHPNGKLVELPLGWYAEDGGFFAMSPGFDQKTHAGVRRRISFQCMFCHNGYPAIEPGADAPGRSPLFPEPLQEGIGCQRCHGPGRAHVEAVAAGEGTEAIRAAMLNPADLPRDRRLEVCMQCHLESTSRPLPFSIVRFDRRAFSYSPAEPLADYMLHFDHPEGVREDKFEIAHHAYRLRKSACFQRSEMTCTTCHDPHETLRGAAGRERQRAICRDCHEPALSALTASGAHPSDQDCATCHMPARRTDDVVRVVMTDHFIQRRAPDRDLLAPLEETVESDEERYRGEVALLYPDELAPTPENELYRAAAQVLEGANLAAGTPLLERLIERHRPREGGFYFHLAEAYWQRNRYEDSLPWYAEAIAREPEHLIALRNYAVALDKTGQPERAEAVLRQALEVEPADAEALTNLGYIVTRLGRPREAARALRKALAADPDFPEAHANLARALAQLGDPAAAIEAARTAVRIQPTYATAHNTLANLVAAQGDAAAAERHYQRAVSIDPDYAEAHYNYGSWLASRERFVEAERALRRALAMEPTMAAAHNNLGNLLASRGDAAAAEQAFRKAIEADPGSAEAHFNLGTALASRNRLDEARARFERALEIRPDYAEARLNLAVALAAAGETAAAREQLATAARSPNAEVREAARRLLEKLP